MQAFSSNCSKRGYRDLPITRFGLEQTVNFPGSTELSQARILRRVGVIQDVCEWGREDGCAEDLMFL